MPAMHIHLLATEQDTCRSLLQPLQMLSDSTVCQQIGGCGMVSAFLGRMHPATLLYCTASHAVPSPCCVCPITLLYSCCTLCVLYLIMLYDSCYTWWRVPWVCLSLSVGLMSVWLCTFWYTSRYVPAQGKPKLYPLCLLVDTQALRDNQPLQDKPPILTSTVCAGPQHNCRHAATAATYAHTRQTLTC